MTLLDLNQLILVFGVLFLIYLNQKAQVTIATRYSWKYHINTVNTIIIKYYIRYKNTIIIKYYI